MYTVMAASEAGFEKNKPQLERGFKRRCVKHNAVKIFVRIVKKLKNLITVSGTGAVRLIIIR